MANEQEALLEVQGLKQYFPISRSFTVKAVDNVSFTIHKGEIYGLVGESGSGKSTTGRSIIRLYKPTAGRVIFRGEDISGDLTKEQKTMLRQKMQMIFQDPMASLNERAKVSYIVSEGIYRSDGKRERAEKVSQALRDVGLLPEFAGRFPHEFSGGQRQRIGIARALVMQPEFIIADEPISALDVSIRAQVLNLLGDLQKEMNLTYLFISHDLSVVRYLSDRVCVMFLGKVCELGITADVYGKPLHPYTRFLLEAVPKPNPMHRKEDKEMLTGEIPSPVNPPSGCRFHTRCPYAKEICSQQEPEMQEKAPHRYVACHFC